jgi:hypothetical protein
VARRPGFFADPVFMAQLDVAFANLYFTAAETARVTAEAEAAGYPAASASTCRVQ